MCPLPLEYVPLYSAREALRLEWDARYVERVSFRGDLAIIARCALVLLRGEGVHAAGEATMAPLTAAREGPLPS